MKKYLLTALFVGICFSQNNDLFDGVTLINEDDHNYIKAKKITSTIDKIFELDNKKNDINDIFSNNNNTIASQRLFDLSLNYNYLFNDVVYLKIILDFHKIISNCAGDNSYTNRKIKNYLESISRQIRLEKGMSNHRKISTQDSGILHWYNNYLEYVSEIETLL